jgi:ankyrin repeat protein
MAAPLPPRPNLTTSSAAVDHAAVERFLELVGAGRLGELRAMLDAAPALVHAAGPHPFWGGRPQALHVAIERGRQEVIDLLLERGADVNGCNDNYDAWSPLMLAASRPSLVSELIRRGALVGLPEALLLADDTRVDERLARSGLPHPAPGGGSWLAFARTPHAIDRLLEHGARPDAPDRWGATPIDALSRLGERGAALLRHLASRGTPPTLMALARLGDLNALARAAARDATQVIVDAVLWAAADGSQTETVRWLLARGARPNARTGPPSRHTALHAAAWHGNLPLVMLLVDSGADVHARDDEYDSTPLGWAETSIDVTGKPGCEQVVEYLRAIGNGAGPAGSSES